jgi:RimJ/RimL family protein N-acetyltransferase
MHSERYWPMFHIRLTTPDLELRHLTEADLAPLADLLPADAEQNPNSTTYSGLDAARNRGAAVHQDYWRALGSWRPASWALNFGVFRDGRLVGNQALEGDDFTRLRTVDSFSFLAVAARNRGWGKQMRAAVLALAFGALDARFAITSAWTDNEASLGVSRALGYVGNGVTAHRRGDGFGEMRHMRLTRDVWLASNWPQQVTVSGVKDCMAYFGLD